MEKRERRERGERREEKRGKGGGGDSERGYESFSSESEDENCVYPSVGHAPAFSFGRSEGPATGRSHQPAAESGRTRVRAPLAGNKGDRSAVNS